MHPNRVDILTDLRRRIDRLAPSGHDGDTARLTLTALRPVAGGVPPVLARNHVHEVLPAGPGDGAAPGFVVAALVSALADDDAGRPVLWCAPARESVETGRLFAPGLAAHGLAPESVIVAEARRDVDVLWTLEQAARSSALAAIAGIAESLDFTTSRRLALAATEGGTPLFLMRPGNEPGASAAATRWRVSSLPAARDPYDAFGPGAPCLRAELIRSRDGRTGVFELEFTHAGNGFEAPAADSVAVAAASAGRAPAPALAPQPSAA